MQLFIRTPDGKNEILNVNLSLSVENITHLIEDKMFVPTFFQRLYRQGKYLNQEDNIEDLCIKDGDTLELNYDILGGGKNASRFKKASSCFRWKWKKKRTRRLQKKRRKMRLRAR
tara:strand:+ start:255 stop:599 length:345 start_codon:yes stop_codon:yes gene_type:complete